MGYSVKSATKSAGNVSRGISGAGGSLASGDIAGAGKQLGNAITGTSSDAGILGVGQYKAKGVDINDKAFNDDSESEARQAQFAQKLAQSEGRTAPTMAAAQVGNARQMDAASIGSAERVSAATIDQTQQGQFRNTQQQLAAALQAQASGQGPSLAQSQLRQATDRNIAQQMAMAASQRGATAGQGLRQLAQGAAAANQQAAGQSADLRMQEQMAAQQQLAGVAAGAREQDIGLAQNQAALSQQATLSNQAASNQFKITQGQLYQQAAMANQDASNQFSLAQAQLTQGANQANQGAALSQTQLNDQQARFYAGGQADMEQRDREAAMALEKLKVDQSLGISGINAGAYAATSQARAGMVGGIGQGLAMGAMMSDERTKKDITDGSNRTDDFLKSFSVALKQQGDSKDPYKGQHQTGEAIGKGLGKLFAGSGSGAPTGAVPAVVDGDVLTGAVIPMMAAHGGKVPGEAAYPGDDPRNDKVPVMTSPGEVVVPRTAADDPGKLQDFVKALSNSEYRYKDGAKHGEGVHVSPMAQELEKSELGRSMITETPDGKVVNYAKAGGLLLATASMLNDRMGDLEAKLAEAFTKKKRSA